MIPNRSATVAKAKKPPSPPQEFDMFRLKSVSLAPTNPRIKQAQASTTSTVAIINELLNHLVFGRLSLMLLLLYKYIES